MKALLERLAGELGPGAVLGPDEDLSAYEQGWRYGSGRAAGLVRPRTVDEVRRVLALTHEAGVRVQPIGANTGLVGASNPDATGEQLVLSFERLSREIEVDPEDGTALVDAGVLLSQLDEALAPHGLCWPIDLGADPQIGGMIATNTGGSRLLRYGDVRANVLGIEVVLADGRVLDGLAGLRKNNTGLDWKQLFIGTSGVFGVVTRARLALSPRPRQTTAVFVGCRDGGAALGLLTHLEREVGELLSAFEVISAPALDATLRHGAGLTDPFGGETPPLVALVELQTTFSPERLDLDDVLEAAFGSYFEHADEDALTDVLVGPAADWWHFRHQVSESLRHEGELLALDLSVPRRDLPAFRDAVAAEVAARAPFIRMCDYGHWGDGGIHVNLVWHGEEAPADPTWRRDLQAAIYDLTVRRFSGSYSAEHGVGPHNQADYDRFTSDLVLDLCEGIGTVLSPGRSLGTLRLGRTSD